MFAIKYTLPRQPATPRFLIYIQIGGHLLSGLGAPREVVLRRPPREDIRAYCRGRSAHSKVSYYVKFVESFSMAVTGKIQKYKMREAATEELGLQAAATTQMA
jgi:acyl-CoA synthetase (AMP-forming)/AMP-acid ligase II